MSKDVSIININGTDYVDIERLLKALAEGLAPGSDVPFINWYGDETAEELARIFEYNFEENDWAKIFKHYYLEKRFPRE